MITKESPHPMYRYYLSLVLILGLAAVAYSWIRVTRYEPGYGWMVLAPSDCPGIRDTC